VLLLLLPIDRLSLQCSYSAHTVDFVCTVYILDICTAY